MPGTSSYFLLPLRERVAEGWVRGRHKLPLLKMAYDIHITRQNWWENDAAQMIGEAEWRALIDADAELRLEGLVKAKLPSGQEMVYTNPLLTLWSGHPDGLPVLFDFRRGKVVVKNPDAATLNKMKEVALLLNARVQGDEGEFYDSNE